MSVNNSHLSQLLFGQPQQPLLRVMMIVVTVLAVVTAGCSSSDDDASSDASERARRSSVAGVDQDSASSTSSSGLGSDPAATEEVENGGTVADAGPDADGADTDGAAPGAAGGLDQGAAPQQANPASDSPTAATTQSPITPQGTPVEVAPSLAVNVTHVENLVIQAVGAGETSGPAIAVSIEITNGQDQSIDATGFAVTAVDADGTPIGPSRAQPGKDFAGMLQPGAALTGVYVFRTDVPGGLMLSISHFGAPVVAQIQL